MPVPELERLATLEAEMRSVKSDLSEIKISLKSLEKIASNGSGAFHAVLILGGAVGWLVGVAVAVYAALRQ